MIGILFFLQSPSDYNVLLDLYKNLGARYVSASNAVYSLQQSLGDDERLLVILGRNSNVIMLNGKITGIIEGFKITMKELLPDGKEVLSNGDAK